MSVAMTRILDPVFGEASIAKANNADACWVRGVISPLDQKSPGGWLANLYGGVQTGDDWARVNVPVFELPVADFNSAAWSYYMTATQTMGVGIVIWIHDAKDPGKRAEVTQVGGATGLGKAAGWNSHVFNIDTTQMFYYGENTTGTALTAGTQYKWSEFQADILFKTWTIYRITLEYGWEASGTFDNVWVADIKLNGMTIFLKPDKTGSGRIMTRASTATSGAIATTLAPKTPFRLMSVALKINTAGTTAESFTVTKDAGRAAAYDQLLASQATNSPAITDLVLPFGIGYEFLSDDEIDCAWANSQSRTYSVIYVAQTVLEN